MLLGHRSTPSIISKVQPHLQAPFHDAWATFHYLSLLRRSLTSRELCMNGADLHGTRFTATRSLYVNATVTVGQESGSDWCKGRGVPVGVFEADASLLELVSVFQLGHIVGVDGRVSHGFLGMKDITVIGVGPFESMNGARRLLSVLSLRTEAAGCRRLFTVTSSTQ